MIGRVPRRVLMVGIVIAASACDNVSWGGVEMGLQGPAADSTNQTVDSLEPGAPPPPPPIPLGPILYAGVRQGDLARVYPVAEITEMGLNPLPGGAQEEQVARQILASRLGVGESLILFHQGVRVGRLDLTDGETTEGPYCGLRAQAEGRLQLIPPASGVQRFLALEADLGRIHAFLPFQELSSVYEQRVASLNLGSQAVPLVGARWPPTLLEIRRDLQVFQLPEGEGPSVMATFLYRDQLQVGPAPTGAYSLMVLGEPRGSTFDLTYSWYRDADANGKGAPRFFSRLDWDDDGDQEILLEVMGESNRWFAALNRGPDGWILTYQDPCGAPGSGT